jgi:hypothetical protein
MPGVVTTLTTHDHVRFRGEHIDDFAFPLVAPLRAYQDCVGHVRSKFDKNFPDASARRVGLADKRYETPTTPQPVFHYRGIAGSLRGWKPQTPGTDRR